MADLTDDAIYDGYLKSGGVYEQMEYSMEMDEEFECSDEVITSQEPEKFIYATAGQIEPIEYSICRGSAE